MKETFRSLTQRHKIGTQGLEVINIAITYGSKYAISLVHDDQSPDIDHCEIRGYSLGDFSLKWTEVVEGTHLAMKEIEQSDDG